MLNGVKHLLAAYKVRYWILRYAQNDKAVSVVEMTIYTLFYESHCTRSGR